jgi:hypothetical protein
MSHHYSGPEYGFPHGDARLDLTDLYAFPKPGRSLALVDSGKSRPYLRPKPYGKADACGILSSRWARLKPF